MNEPSGVDGRFAMVTPCGESHYSISDGRIRKRIPRNRRLCDVVPNEEGWWRVFRLEVTRLFC